MAKLFITIALIFFYNFAEAEIVDVCKDNFSCKKTYEKNILNFDFEQGTVKHTYKFSPELQSRFQSFYEIERDFKIVSVDDEGIIFEQTLENHLALQHSLYLDDKYLVGSNYYNSKFKKKADESGGVDKGWYRVKIIPEKKIIKEIYWPLTSKPKESTINLSFSEKQYKQQQFVNAVVFVATIYLYARAVKKFNNKKNQIKSNTQSQSNAAQQGSKCSIYTYCPDFAKGNPYTPNWAKGNPYTPPWVPTARRNQRLAQYLSGFRLFPF